MKLLFCCLLILLSCSKQEPERLKPTHRREDLTEKTSCQSLVYLKGAFQKKNFLNFLDCMGWEKKHQGLKSTFLKIPENDFDYIVAPINNSFFNNSNARSRYFALFQILNRNGAKGFQSFDNYLLNFVPPWVEVARSYLKKTKKQNKLKFLYQYQLSKEKIRKELVFFTYLQKYFLQNDQMRESLKKSFHNEKIVKSVANLFGYIEKLSTEDKMLLAKVVWGREGLISSLAQNKDSDLTSFFQFIVKNQAIIKSTGIALKNNYHKKFSCRIDSNKKYSILFKNYLNREIQAFASSEKGSEKLVEVAHRIHFMDKMCPSEGIANLKKVSLKALKSIASLCENRSNCHLFKSVLKGFEGQEIETFFNFLSNASFDDLLKTITSVLTTERETLDKLSELLHFVPKSFLQTGAQAYLGNNSDSLLGLLFSLIHTFDEVQLKRGADLIAKFLADESLVKEVNPFFLELFHEFPEMILHYHSLYLKDHKVFYKSFLSVLNSFNRERVFDFVKFLSTDSLLKLYQQLIGKNVGSKLVLEIFSKKENEVVDVFQNKEQKKIVYTDCLAFLERDYVTMNSFFKNYSKKCNNEAYGLVHRFTSELSKITNSRRRMIVSELFSPELLAQIVGITQKISKKELPIIIESLNNAPVGPFLDLLLNYDTVTSLKEVLEQRRSKQKLDKLFTLFDKSKYQKVPSLKLPKCRELDKKVGSKPCLSSLELKNWLVGLKNILSRKDNHQKTLAENFFELFYDQYGVMVPLDKPQKFISSDLKELLSFLVVLSSPENSNNILYASQYNGSEREIMLTVMEEVEMLLREVSFENNYYGAYFKNEIANSKDYVKGVEKMKKRFNTWGWLLDTFGYIKKENEINMDNAARTIESLLRLAQPFKIGKKQTNFSNITHGIVATLVKSSSEQSKEISVKTKPSPKEVKKHNGILLTHLAKISGLTNLGRYFSSRIKKLETFFSDSEFIEINNNLLKKFNPGDLGDFLIKVVDELSDEALLSKLSSLSLMENNESLRMIETIAFDLFYLVSISDVSKEEGNRLLNHVLSFIRTLKEKDFLISKQKDSLKMMNGFLRELKKDKELASFTVRLIGSIKAPKDYHFLTELTEKFNSDYDIKRIMKVIYSGVDLSALTSLLAQLEKNEILYRKKENDFQEAFKKVNFSFKDFSLIQIRAIVDDIKMSFEIVEQ